MDNGKESLEETVSQQQRRIDELEQTVRKMMPSRRDTLKAGAAAGVGLLGFGAGNASADLNDGDTQWGSDSNRDDYIVDHVDANVIDTGELSNIRVVGPSGFDSVQAAHDDLPSKGGWIIQTAPVSETGVSITKPVKWSQTGAAERVGTGPAALDTSGGAGVTVDAQGAVLEDVRIEGDGTGGDGLTLTTAGITCRNVYVRDKGNDGVVFDGPVQGCRLDLTASGSGRHGFHVKTDKSGGSYLNENECHWSAFNNGDDGIHSTGDWEIRGNTWTMVHSAGNSGWGWYHTDTGCRFDCNMLLGYGMESNGTGDIHILDGDGRGGNTLSLSNLPGPTEINTGMFSAIAEAYRDGDNLAPKAGTIPFHLRDDWGDGQLTNRNNAARGVYTEAVAGGLPGQYRPRWRPVEGSVSVTDGAMVMAGGGTSERVATDSSLRYGSFEADVKYNSTPGSGDAQMQFLKTDTDNYATVKLASDGSVPVVVSESGATSTILSGSWSVGTSVQTLRITRDQSDNWELFVNGTSQDTATHTYSGGSREVNLWNFSDAEVEFRSIRFD